MTLGIHFEMEIVPGLFLLYCRPRLPNMHEGSLLVALTNLSNLNRIH